MGDMLLDIISSFSISVPHKGGITSMRGPSTTIDAGLGIIATGNIEDGNYTLNSLSGVGFGGGTWKNYTFVWAPFKGRSY